MIPGISEAEMWRAAERGLAGVGDQAAGEWRETGKLAVHIRRRLTPEEMRRGGITGALDIRGTPEATRRIAAVRPYLPAHMAHLSEAELG